jgi:outer membrane protein TolC
MNPAGESHQVTPEFRARLEWQIDSALRRESRFTEPVSGGTSRLHVAIVAVVALFLGGIAVTASGELQDAKQRELLLATAHQEEALVRMRVELARADLQEAQKRYETGTSDRQTLLAAQRQLRAMEMELQRIRLDMEEMQQTSASPRNDLQAPLVGKRDFVRERLRLQLDTAERGLAAAEEAVAQAKQRVSVGLAPMAAQLQADAELSAARARLQELRIAIEMRERALTGSVKVEELATEQRRKQLMLQQEVANQQLQLTRLRVEELRRLVEIGVASQLDLKRVEVEVLEREVELRKVRQEIEMLTAPRR